MRISLAALWAAFVCLGLASPAPAQPAVSVALVLAADVSGSITRDQFLMVADGFEVFAFALRAKLIREVAGVDTRMVAGR